MVASIMYSSLRDDGAAVFEISGPSFPSSSLLLHALILSTFSSFSFLFFVLVYCNRATANETHRFAENNSQSKDLPWFDG